MHSNKQQGVVSLFIVIFTTLLLTVLAVGFLRLMIQEQTQATNQDLSQSAYDSAVSGVEDAKRVLRACNQGDADACAAIEAGECNTVSAAKVVSLNGDSTETIIKADGTSTNMNQGYTCVLIDKISDDYMGDLLMGETEIVALDAASESNPADAIKTITIEWMHRGYNGGESASIEKPTVAAGVSLPALNGWNAKAPSMLRVQAVLPTAANTVNTDDLDSSVVSTLFLRPSTVDAAQGFENTFTLPGARAASGGDTPVSTSPKAVECSAAGYSNDTYACKVTLKLDDTGVRSVPLGSKVAFLRITSLYRGTSYRVTVNGVGKLVFDGVQPVVDSTGRAGNIYRRISSRLDMTQVEVPPAVVSITGDMCKDFYVTDTEAKSLSTCSTQP